MRLVKTNRLTTKLIVASSLVAITLVFWLISDRSFYASFPLVFVISAIAGYFLGPNLKGGAEPSEAGITWTTVECTGAELPEDRKVTGLKWVDVGHYRHLYAIVDGIELLSTDQGATWSRVDRSTKQ